MGSRMKATFSFSAGALVRKEVIFQLKTAAQSRGLALGILDDGGWISRTYSVTVEGEEPNVKDYLQAVENWAQGESS